MRRKIAYFVLFVTLVYSGCSSGLSRSTAYDLIKADPRFQKPIKDQRYDPERGPEWFPVATRELVEVTGVTMINDSTASATFTYRLKAIPGSGATITDTSPGGGNADFQKYDDGWRIVMLSSSNGMPMQ